jgi:hypothetical protein
MRDFCSYVKNHSLEKIITIKVINMTNLFSSVSKSDRKGKIAFRLVLFAILLIITFSTKSFSRNNPTEVANIYSYKEIVFVNLKDQIKGDVFIYTISGQLVASTPSAKGTSRINLENTGNYIVKVITQKSTVVRKIWIQ